VSVRPRRLAAAALGAALVAFAALLAPAPPAAAATLLDPSETLRGGRLRLDGEADLVLSRRLRFEDSDRVVEARARNFTLSGSYGLLDGLDGFLTVGTTRMRLRDRDALPDGRFEGEVGFLFGGGVRYRFVDERYFKVGARLGVARLESESRGTTATLVEYDLLLGASLHVTRELVPYVALGASLVDGQFAGAFGRREVRQEDVLGAVVGLRYAATAQVQATVAGRFVDEESVAFALSFGF
jgi:hypothetical protein